VVIDEEAPPSASSIPDTDDKKRRFRRRWSKKNNNSSVTVEEAKVESVDSQDEGVFSPVPVLMIDTENIKSDKILMTTEIKVSACGSLSRLVIPLQGKCVRLSITSILPYRLWFKRSSERFGISSN